MQTKPFEMWYWRKDIDPGSSPAFCLLFQMELSRKQYLYASKKNRKKNWRKNFKIVISTLV